MPNAKQPRKDKTEVPEKKLFILHKDGKFDEIFKCFNCKANEEITQ